MNGLLANLLTIIDYVSLKYIELIVQIVGVRVDRAAQQIAKQLLLIVNRLLLRLLHIPTEQIGRRTGKVIVYTR